MTAEEQRLHDSRDRKSHWKRWGPYLSERAWGTVREDYSPGGDAWSFVPHDHARSKAYRWNEDGIAGICDRHQKLCFAHLQRLHTCNPSKTASTLSGRDPAEPSLLAVCETGH